MKLFIRWIEDINIKDQQLVGQKCASLGELLRIGMQVPPGFCVTTEAYKSFLDSVELQPQIENLLQNIIPSDPRTLESSSNKIRRYILETKIPKEIIQEIMEAYRKLDHHCDEDIVPVSIRSSGTAEDQPNDSFAGQYTTFLSVVGIDDVLTKIKECWASMYSKQATYYRVKKGYGRGKHYMAVIVQQMIPAEASGVMFTVSPTGRSTEMLVNSIWGLGKPLVSGQVTSDYYIISKEQLNIIDQYVEIKESMAICSLNSGVQNVPVPVAKRSASSLTFEQIKVLGDIGKKIENHFGKSQDVEWVFWAGNIMILQSRPIPTLQHIKPLPPFPIQWECESDGQIIWTRGMGVPARFVDPVTPLSFELVKTILASCWEDAMKKLPLPYKSGQVEFRLFNSYLYWNIDLEQKPKFSLRLLFFLIKLWVALRRGIDKWKGHLPTYLAEVENLKQFNMKAASLNELYIHFENICNLFSGYFVWEVYLGETLDAFFDIYLEVVSKLTGESKVQVAKLVQGVDSRTQEMSRKLGKLVLEASKKPFIRDVILSESSFEMVMKNLQESEDAVEFLRQFQEFLEKYGHRSPKPDWFFPSWKEDPSPILDYVCERLIREDYDFEGIFKKQVEEREALISRLYEQVKYHPIKRILFQWFTKTARRWAPVREDRQHYVKFTSQLLKDTLKEFNIRLIEKGILSKPNDIFFLTLGEISKIVQNVDAGKSPSFKNVVPKRRNRWQKAFELVPPPRIVGPLVADHILIKEKRLVGMPCSPGRAMGKARVLSNPDDFDKFRHREILVVPETGPEWILLFDLAKAIVTDYGMPLSHSALLAREFGIPAVSGTKIATGVIKTGQIIVVDGDNGVVVMM